MQFFAVIIAAAMASVAAAETVTVYACESTSSGVASPTIGSTGIVTPTPTGQPIFTGAASMNAPALGMMVAGGLALFM